MKKRTTNPARPQPLPPPNQLFGFVASLTEIVQTAPRGQAPELRFKLQLPGTDKTISVSSTSARLLARHKELTSLTPVTLGGVLSTDGLSFNATHIRL
jgi:hypothetical protein